MLVDFEIGTKVRMVQTDSCGTIVGEVTTSEVDGGPRIAVRWDNSGNTNSWNPAFLRLADTDPEEDPDVVEDGSLRRVKGGIETNGDGLVVIREGGFERI